MHLFQLYYYYFTKTAELINYTRMSNNSPASHFYNEACTLIIDS